MSFIVVSFSNDCNFNHSILDCEWSVVCNVIGNILLLILSILRSFMFYCTIFGYSYCLDQCPLGSWYVGLELRLLLGSLLLTFGYMKMKILLIALRLVIHFYPLIFYSTMTKLGIRNQMFSGLLHWSSQLASLSLGNKFIDYYSCWFSRLHAWIILLI